MSAVRRSLQAALKPFVQAASQHVLPLVRLRTLLLVGLALLAMLMYHYRFWPVYLWQRFTLQQSLAGLLIAAFIPHFYRCCFGHTDYPPRTVDLSIFLHICDVDQPPPAFPVTIGNLKSLHDFLGDRDEKLVGLALIRKSPVAKVYDGSEYPFQTPYEFTERHYAAAKACVMAFHAARKQGTVLEENTHNVKEFYATTSVPGRITFSLQAVSRCYACRAVPDKEHRLSSCRFLFVFHEPSGKGQRVTVLFTDTHYGQYLPIGSQIRAKDLPWNYKFVSANVSDEHVRYRIVEIAEAALERKVAMPFAKWESFVVGQGGSD